MTTIYKLLRAAEWASFQAAGEFAGSPDDLRDGYIHMSTAEQVAGTRAKYFADQPDAMLLAIDAEGTGRGAALGAVARRGAVPPPLPAARSRRSQA